MYNIIKSRQIIFVILTRHLYIPVYTCSICIRLMRRWLREIALKAKTTRHQYISTVATIEIRAFL